MQRQQELRMDALAIFSAAVTAADAGEAVRRHLRRNGDKLLAGNAEYCITQMKSIFLVAVGKASAQMAQAVEAEIGSLNFQGLVITKYGHAAEYSGQCEVIESAHPIPDNESVRAGCAVLAMLERITSEDLLVVAVSGGASALLCAPVENVTLEAKCVTTDLLLRAGADIQELNCVRKHLSRLKGGNLVALANGAHVLSLVLSDVVGDAPDVIGSGLTSPDPSTFSQAIDVLTSRRIAPQVPAEVMEYLERGSFGDRVETPKNGSEVFARSAYVLVGSGRQALLAASDEAHRLGYKALILTTRCQGEARDVARVHTQILWESRLSGHPLAPPVCLLSGGETTVTVRGDGMGGRSQEFALAAAVALDGAMNVVVLSAGTDGSDGPTDAAGAIAAGDTIPRAVHLGMDAKDYLRRNDSYRFFQALNDHVRTGPTGTNVMDLIIMLAGSED